MAKTVNIVREILLFYILNLWIKYVKLF